MRSGALDTTTRSFDRTYEELKLAHSARLADSSKSGFDRTYEELKPDHRILFR